MKGKRVGIFKKKINYEKFYANQFSAEYLKDSMKVAGLVPGESMREFIGWTYKDDAEAVSELKFRVGEKKELLNELKTSGATLRKIMETEISIKSDENWLKANNHI